jgi:hypothetical protein
VATGRGLALYSDDAGIRALARNEHKVQGFCSQAFLRFAVEKRKLSSIEYEEALLVLFRNNYHFVSESAETVVLALRKDSFAITPLTRRLVCRLREPNINHLVSGTILGHAIAEIWTHAGEALRSEWFDIAVESLAAREEFADICSAVVRGAAVSLWHLPAAFIGLCRRVELNRRISPQQAKVWAIVWHAAAHAAINACDAMSPRRVHLRREWQEHLHAVAMIE